MRTPHDQDPLADPLSTEFEPKSRGFGYLYSVLLSAPVLLTILILLFDIIDIIK